MIRCRASLTDQNSSPPKKAPAETKALVAMIATPNEVVRPAPTAKTMQRL